MVGSHGRSHPGVNPVDENTELLEAEHETQNSGLGRNNGEPKQEGEIPQELLRKYILYAREKCRPKLYQIDQDKVARLFADMRRESLATGAYPITVSYFPSLFVLSHMLIKSRSVISKLSCVSPRRSVRCVSLSTVRRRISIVPSLLQLILSSAPRRCHVRRRWPEHLRSIHLLDRRVRRQRARVTLNVLPRWAPKMTERRTWSKE